MLLKKEGEGGRGEMQYSNNMLLHNNLLQASGLLLQLELLQPRL